MTTTLTSQRCGDAVGAGFVAILRNAWHRDKKLRGVNGSRTTSIDWRRIRSTETQKHESLGMRSSPRKTSDVSTTLRLSTAGWPSGHIASSSHPLSARENGRLESMGAVERHKQGQWRKTRLNTSFGHGNDAAGHDSSSQHSEVVSCRHLTYRLASQNGPDS